MIVTRYVNLCKRLNLVPWFHLDFPKLGEVHLSLLLCLSFIKYLGLLCFQKNQTKIKAFYQRHFPCLFYFRFISKTANKNQIQISYLRSFRYFAYISKTNERQNFILHVTGHVTNLYLTGRLWTPVWHAFSYGIRHVFIVIKWTVTRSFVNHNENMSYPVWKCLPYGSPQPP